MLKFCYKFHFLFPKNEIRVPAFPSKSTDMSQNQKIILIKRFFSLKDINEYKKLNELMTIFTF